MTRPHDGEDAAIRNQYRTSAGYQMENRRLLLRGGAYDGRTWVGVVATGDRVFCGDGEWSMSGVYVVSEVVELDEHGEPMNIAVPAFAEEPPADH
jgi:hypothetical protein